MNQELYVIAGPNGAGKSSFGNVIIGSSISIFNGDKVLKDYLDRNPDDTKRDAHEHTQNIFDSSAVSAINAKKPFGYETNYSDESALATPRLFKSKGYKINMIFFAMASIKDCELRVNERFRSNCGHNVEKTRIAENYIIGASNVDLSYKEFDVFMMYDNSIVDNIRFPNLLLEAKNGVFIFINKNMPDWLDQVFPELAKELNKHIQSKY